MCSPCVFAIPRLCRATDHTHMNYHQVVSPQSVCTCVNCDDVFVFLRWSCSLDENKAWTFKHQCKRNKTGSIFLLCVCPQTVLLRGHVRSPVPTLLVSRHLHTHSPNPKALCADNPNQWWVPFCCLLTSNCFTPVTECVRSVSCCLPQMTTYYIQINHTKSREGCSD